jgi:uncharacterized membrane protein
MIPVQTHGVSRMRGLSALLIACSVGMSLAEMAQAQPRGPGAPSAPGAPRPQGGPGAPSSPGGGQISPTFLFKICNKSTDARVADIFVAVVSVLGGGQYRNQGWWRVPKSECVDIGQFNRPGVFVHGMAGDLYWGDAPPKGVSLCVNMSAGFDYTFAAGRACAAGEEEKPFSPIEVQPQFNVMTYTLN